ncbi:outer membrane lipoprotein-sorting protein [Planctomycetota bacterium]
MHKLVTGMLLSLAFCLAVPGAAFGLTGREIMEKADKFNRAADEVVELTMQIVSGAGHRRTRKLTVYVKSGEGDDDKTLIRFTAPAGVKDTGLLTHEEGDKDLQWLYLPDLRKSKRISGASKANSFVGSDFSNYDMRTEDLHNHAYELRGEEVVADRPCYKVEARPKDADTEEATGYSQRFFYIDKERWVAQKVEYVDRNQKPLKVLNASQLEQVKGLWRARKVVVENVQEGSRTLLVQTGTRKINEGLGDRQVSKRALEAR